MTRDQKRFTISEATADWREPMVPRRIMRPSMLELANNCIVDTASSRGVRLDL